MSNLLLACLHFFSFFFATNQFTTHHHYKDKVVPTPTVADTVMLTDTPSPSISESPTPTVSLPPTVTLTPTPTASPTPTITKVGNDISYPQCGQILPNGQGFGIVGINGGLATTDNPCLSTELLWANQSLGTPNQAKVQLYVNTGN